MRVWLDDVRQMPVGFDAWCKTYKEAIDLIPSISYISFDHDLENSDTRTGYDVACQIENAVARGEMACPRWAVHSANPVGRRNIEAAMRSAERLAEP